MKHTMKSDPVPELRELINVAAATLKNSTEDRIVIAGADNKALVKARSATAEKLLAENMVLFPTSVEGALYLVCIAQRR